MPQRNEALRQKILEEHAKTPNYPTIAKTLGISRLQVAHYAQALGLKSTRATTLIKVGEDFQCTKCDRILPQTEFLINSNGAMLSYCKTCRKYQIWANDHKSAESYLKERYRHIKKRNMEIGVLFTISYENVLELWLKQKGLCFYTSKPLLTTEIRENATNAVSFDKIEPAKGYVWGNVVLCSTRANVIKSACSLEEIAAWLPIWYEKILVFQKSLI